MRSSTLVAESGYHVGGSVLTMLQLTSHKPRLRFRYAIKSKNVPRKSTISLSSSQSYYRSTGVPCETTSDFNLFESDRRLQKQHLPRLFAYPRTSSAAAPDDMAVSAKTVDPVQTTVASPTPRFTRGKLTSIGLVERLEEFHDHKGPVSDVQEAVKEFNVFQQRHRDDYETTFNLYRGTSAKETPTELDHDQMEYLIDLFDDIFFGFTLPTVQFEWHKDLSTKPGVQTYGQCRESKTELEWLVEIDPSIISSDIDESAWLDHLGTLLHELVHVFLEHYSCKGNTQAGCVHKHRSGELCCANGDVGHGPAFQLLAAAVERRARQCLGLDITLGRKDAVYNHSDQYGTLPFLNQHHLLKCFGPDEILKFRAPDGRVWEVYCRYLAVLCEQAMQPMCWAITLDPRGIRCFGVFLESSMRYSVPPETIRERLLRRRSNVANMLELSMLSTDEFKGLKMLSIDWYNGQGVP